MATVAHPGTTPRRREEQVVKGKKVKRTDIWSNLLRQTREAQARSRTQTVQHRQLIVCGGSSEDQRAFVQSLARPPPPTSSSRNRDVRPQRPKGEVKLSNRHAYGYGHMTLYTPPQQNGGILGAEAEEAVRLEVHTVPEPEAVYEGTLRRLLEARVEQEQDAVMDEQGIPGVERNAEGARRPHVSLLLSWREPWRFMSLLRQWLQLLAKALLPPNSPDEDSLGVLKEHKLALTIVVQHVEAQEGLEREGYGEESFDYISQCLRTALLPLSAALVYSSSAMPPQQPGSALSELQKMLFTGLTLDLAPLSPAPAKGSTTIKRDDLALRHNVVDRMAIVVPSGWDSVGKIRLLSETFSPEAVLEAWVADMNVPVHAPIEAQAEGTSLETNSGVETPANGGAERERHSPEQEVYATSEAGSDDLDLASQHVPPSKQAVSAITTYEQSVMNPNAHKSVKRLQVEVTTKPTQQFLAEMRSHLLELEAQDAERAEREPPTTARSTTAGSSHNPTARMIGLPSGEQTGALSSLGDVSFNVGGVNYNTVSAEAAIDRLIRSQQPPQPTGLESPLSTPTGAGNRRDITPRQPRREDKLDATPKSPQRSSARSTTSMQSESKPMDKLEVDKLEEYFASLMSKGSGTPGGGGASGGRGSGASTPSKAPAR
ncbi:hypothetical protein LTR62_008754 [Meristemomyces frigidus]|uniref:Dynein light intermediate chain n=1 Tax=Meristemomyces frigidus TaxID=1508187 RepID=A0AAN7TD65_9PEZI|nr:hypothetical protein LTR62_008754 [Meristemomyces frigidus]